MSEMWADFQNCHIGHKHWSLAKVRKVTHIVVFLPHGGEIELIFYLWASVSDIQADFRNIPIWS